MNVPLRMIGRPIKGVLRFMIVSYGVSTDLPDLLTCRWYDNLMGFEETDEPELPMYGCCLEYDFRTEKFYILRRFEEYGGSCLS